MDRHAADRLVKNRPEAHDPAHLVEKEEIEQSRELWEEALSEALPPRPSISRERGETRRVPTDNPLRAPLADDLTIDPVLVEGRDGFVRSPDDALRERLREQVFDRVRVEIPVRLPSRKNRRPARRVYSFDQPVDAAGNASGTLYALSEDGNLIPFEGGVRARRVVEVIEEEQFGSQPPVEEEMDVFIRSGIAHWTHA